jgi:class 3 adenylate cyclase/alpha-beta hydrolase superfamily lysophospholipase
VEREIRYAKNGDVHIAYTVVGDGPIDLVYCPGIWSNLDLMWDEPRWGHYLDRLASFSRLIVFDMRGIGLSDRGPEPPVVELMADDVRAVLNAAGSQTPVLFGGARGAAPVLLFAATHPDRVHALVLYAAIAKTVRGDDYPIGRTAQEQEGFRQAFVRNMGTGRALEDMQGPSGAYDERFVRWWARFERLTASPGDWGELAAILAQVDVRAALPLIQAPTLILNRRDDKIVAIDHGRYAAERIPGAKFVELEGNDHIPFLGDADAIVDEIEEFVTGVRPGPETDRVLATVLFTDIVGSTERAAAIGDRAWRELLERHNSVVRKELERHRGREVDTAGDGFMAAFDGPARAIRCASTIIGAVRDLGLEIRTGVHTGECEQVGEKLGGIAVHIAARVSAAAGPGEVLVSQTVKDLVAGSEIPFEDRGAHQLKGVPDEWRLFAVSA